MFDAGAASVIYNATHYKNTRHGIIAATRVVCDATSHLGDGLRLILRQRVRDSVRSVRAIRNTRVVQMETKVVADVFSLCLHLCTTAKLGIIPLNII